MAKTRIHHHLRNSQEVEKLVADVLSLSASGSQLEDFFWEKKLTERLDRLLNSQHQAVLDLALDLTFKSQTDAFEILADAIETSSESIIYQHQDETYQALLIAIPIIAQTKYTIPSGPILQEEAAQIVDYLNEFVFCEKTRMSIVPWLYSIDQIPQTHIQTRQLLQQMAKSAIEQSDLRYELKNMPETIAVLADPRFIICTITTLLGQPMFLWQAEDGVRVERSSVLKQWQQATHSNFARLLPGCEFEVMLPDAFFTNCREADKRIRPLSLRAAINYLETTLELSPAELSCVVAAFGAEVADEFRISFSIKGHPDIIYGVVWPLYDRESIDPEDIDGGSGRNSTIRLIADTLHEAGVVDVFKHAMLFTPESCEDCGVPLFPNRSAEVVHAEMPLDTPAQQLLFH